MLILPLRVLVLSDDFFQRAIAVNMLRHLGCDVVLSAFSPSHALHTLRKAGPVDIALCDLRMDGPDSLDFLQRSARGRLVRSVIINNSLAEDVLHAAKQLIPLLGLRMLGEVVNPLQLDTLGKLLEDHLCESVPVASSSHADVTTSEEEICSAMADGQMQTYFQPKINLLNNEVYGVEALARWNHPGRGVISPSVFMPTIERCNLLDELFFSQMQHGLHLQQYFLKQGVSLNVAFNLQPSQLSHVALVSKIKSILDEFKLPGAGVTFELTETGLVETSAPCMENMVRLRMMGCGLSIDDFGSGFSSLQRLCQFPFSEIKLDGEFIQALDDGPRSRAVISSALALGESLGMRVVAEGIETRCQYQKLIDLGYVHGQGYFFAKPMTIQDLYGWFKAGCPHAGLG